MLTLSLIKAWIPNHSSTTKQDQCSPFLKSAPWLLEQINKSAVSSHNCSRSHCFNLQISPYATAHASAGMSPLLSCLFPLMPLYKWPTIPPSGGLAGSDHRIQENMLDQTTQMEIGALRALKASSKKIKALVVNYFDNQVKSMHRKGKLHNSVYQSHCKVAEYI